MKVERNMQYKIMGCGYLLGCHDQMKFGVGELVKEVIKFVIKSSTDATIVLKGD